MLLYMENEPDIPNLPGYLSIKEVAQAVHLSQRRVRLLIQSGRLPAFRMAGMLVVPAGEVKTYQQGITGRPRRNTPNWRIAIASDVHTWLHVFVGLREGRAEELLQKLGAIRKGGEHMFPGTAARYIALSDQRPNEVQILLIWRGSLIPTPEEREAALEELRRDLADLVDWDTARYETAQVLMHT